MTHHQEVSICIPTANLGERSLEYLECCLSSIEAQDYPRITVHVSDHSQDDDIQNHLIENWSDHEGKCSFVLDYVRYEEGYGSAVANLNNAIDQVCEDHFVKMLFQDDILKAPEAISMMVAKLQAENAHWVAVGCDHIDDDDADMNYPHPPRWIADLSMAHGRNLIGSPSVVMFRNCDMRMDPNLCYLNDCEFYYRLGQAYGPPALLNELLVTIRMRSQGLSSILDIGEVKARESLYLQKKFGEV